MGLGRGFPRSASGDLLINDLGFAAMKAGFVIERHSHPRGLHCGQTRKSLGHSTGSYRQLVEQRLSILQVECVEALSEPAVDRSEQFASLLRLALVAPEASEAYRRAQLPRFCLLLTRNCECVIKILLCFFGVRLARLECDFPGNAMHLGLAPFFLPSFYFFYRVVNSTPSIVKLAKVRVGHCQMPQMPRFIKSGSS